MTTPPDDTTRADAGADDAPWASVVVCSLNRRESLRRCLASLAEQPGVAGIEALVVDNGSEDGTDESVRAMAADYPTRLRVVVEPRRGLSIARNTGLEHARGRVAVFVDDDVTFQEAWLDGLRAAFEGPGVVGAGGPIEPVFPAGTDAWFAEEALRQRDPTTGIFDRPGGEHAFDPRGTATPRGGNMAVLRDLALELGGFREDLGWGKGRVPGEETDLFVRVFATGRGEVRYLPPMAVNHHLDLERTNAAYARKWHEGYGRASIRMKGDEPVARRALRFVDQLGVFALNSVRSWTPGGRRSLRVLKKRWQALGRLREMLGR